MEPMRPALEGEVSATGLPGKFLFLIQFSSVAQSCPTLSDHMGCGTLGLPGHHHLPEFTQIHDPSGCEGKLGVALESLQGLSDLT